MARCSFQCLDLWSSKQCSICGLTRDAEACHTLATEHASLRPAYVFSYPHTTPPRAALSESMSTNSLSFGCFWISGVQSCHMRSEPISTAFLCKARWSATYSEGALCVCLWKRSYALNERVQRIHPIIKWFSSFVFWEKLQLGEYGAEE